VSIAAGHQSLWIDSGPPQPVLPTLDRDVEADLVVVGAGIAGVTTALLAGERGLRVVLLEADRVAHGVTGHTTAKVSSQHGLIYDRLSRDHGPVAARLYGQANEAALAWIADRVERDAIDCDFRRQPAYAYVADASRSADVEAEAAAARAAGLPAALAESTPLPYPVAAALRFDDQAELHPCKYLLALAERIAAAGGEIYEGSRALSLDSGDGRCRIATAAGSVTAPRAVIATHFPFPDRSLAFARLRPERSYALACRIKGSPPPGMHISADSPTRSVRAAPTADGELLLVGGEGHKVGSGGDTRERYRALERFAREHWDVTAVEYSWSTQDNVTPDGLPYVGRLTPRSDRVLMATGFAKWGMTGGTAAAAVLVDLVLGRANPYADLFDPWRLTLRASARALIEENAQVALHFVGDRLTKPGLRSIDDLAPGEGDIVRSGQRKVAAYRDSDGGLTAVSTRCTHLGCQVNWNAAERSWDCPCHGSRFAPDGSVLQGPAVRPLERRPTA
jgi:glycine/D-amino acid oxidase-like deaminating enzyme/nitrite reductase/ring-hydroxylating ferredoxin subunit